MNMVVHIEVKKLCFLNLLTMRSAFIMMSHHVMIVSLLFFGNFVEVCLQVSVGASEALHCSDSSN